MTVTNEIDWKIHESLTKYIYETLCNDYNINIEGYLFEMSSDNLHAMSPNLL